MSCSVLHHIEVCVKDEHKLLRLLTKGFGFRPFARRLTPLASKWALRSGKSVFIVTKRNSCCAVLQNGTSNSALNQDTKKSNTTVTNLQDGHEKSNLNGVNKNSQDCNKIASAIIKNVDSEELNNKSNRSFKSEIPPNCKNMLGCKDIISDTVVQQHKEHWTVFCCRDKPHHTNDSVFNVALVVKNVDQVTNRVKSRGGQVLQEPTDIYDDLGRVRYSIVTSCCGNIVHTLIDKVDYNGHFLPGFEQLSGLENVWTNMKLRNGTGDTSEQCPLNSTSTVTHDTVIPEGKQNIIVSSHNADSPSCPQESEDDPLVSTYIDHVTYVCDTGKCHDLITWYEHCFGMKRFFTNRDESEEAGFVLGGSIGLRLKAMEYWKCAEMGLAPPSAKMDDMSLKLVVAEALPEVSESHVNTFLQAHEGPGIQHIALHTATMTATVQSMVDNGVEFRKPPPVYYDEGIKLEEIEETGHSHEIDLFRELGILLDTEADVFADVEPHQDKKGYLMQIFTTPIFNKDTFFLEVIQRCGARGFGAGNITALAKSIILHKQQLEASHV